MIKEVSGDILLSKAEAIAHGVAQTFTSLGECTTNAFASLCAPIQPDGDNRIYSPNLIYKHIRTAIEEAAERKAFFESQFETLIHEKLQIQDLKINSFHLLAKLMDGTNNVALVQALEKRGVSSHPLSKCYLGEPQNHGLILGYSCVNKSFMAQFLGKMAKVVKDFPVR
jgi:DNA-binding transcriptional MocR family regulator